MISESPKGGSCFSRVQIIYHLRKINCSDTVCVADRFLSDDEAYFLFYTNDRVKIVFKKAFFIWKSKRRKKFMEIQMRLNNFGYSSFDCS